MRGSRAFAVNRKPAEGQAQPAWREATALPSTVRPPNAKRIPRTRPPCGLKAADDHQITRPERMTFMAEPVSDLETAASLCASYNDHGAACSKSGRCEASSIGLRRNGSGSRGRISRREAENRTENDSFTPRTNAFVFCHAQNGAAAESARRKMQRKKRGAKNLR